MKQTIRTMANELGLSPATVSKALTGQPSINESTRAKVVAHAKKAGYEAPSKRGASAPRVAIIIQDESNVDISTVFYYDVLLGFKEHANKLGMEVLILSITAEDLETYDYDEYISAKNIDGVFIMGFKTSAPYYQQLATTAVKSVALDIVMDNPALGSVETDNIAGANLAIEHLASLGHKRIGFIGGHSEAYVSRERLTGYMGAMCRAGLVYEKSLVFDGGFTESGGACAAEYFAKLGVSAVFCASDLMAVGATRRFVELGLSIPKDMSIVGFDNAPYSALCTPPLTTIAQDRPRIGVTAAALLDGLMRNVPVNRAVLPPSLVIRESTAPLAG